MQTISDTDFNAHELQENSERWPRQTGRVFEGWLKRRRMAATRPAFTHPLICPVSKLRRGVCTCKTCMPGLKRIQAADEAATVDGEREQGQIVCLAAGVASGDNRPGEGRN